MSKPIRVTDTIMEKIMAEFRENVMSAKMFDGKITYNKSFKWEDDSKAKLVFSHRAFSKMMQLLNGFNSEVAWHGTAYRSEENESEFRIDDVLIYPQLVSGSTVETDQAEYQNWLYALDDEQFDNLRMQGHSHVDFATTPSSVDLTHQGKILDQLEDDMFYIFMIWNKKMEHTIRIFDLKHNTLYETADIEISIEDNGYILPEAKKSVKPKYQTGFAGGSGAYGGGYNPPAKNTAQATPAAAAPAKQEAKIVQVAPPETAQKTSAPASRPKYSEPPIGKSGKNFDPGYDDDYGYSGPIRDLYQQSYR